MKVLVSVDIEGVAGVTHPEQVRPGNPEYERARRWMTNEANAAVRGAFEGGASEVRVSDSHGSFRNLILDDLDDRARIVTGKPRHLGMMAGIEGCNAAFMVGYHTGATHRGVLAHTISSFAFRSIKVNDQELNEAGLYGGLAAEFGVPVALICGDNEFIAETQALFPGVTAVETKTAQSGIACTSLTPSRACRDIETAATRAVVVAPKLELIKVEEAILRCEVGTQSTEQADLFCQWPTLVRLDATTFRFEEKSMENIVRIINSLSAMSFMLR